MSSSITYGTRDGFRMSERVTDRVAREVVRRMEEEDVLPLPPRRFDVVVDDPDLSQRHDFKGITACSAYAAATEAVRRAVRKEGFRVMAGHPAGDELTVTSEAAREGVAMFATVHREGEHPVLSEEAAQRRKEREAIRGTPRDLAGAATTFFETGAEEKPQSAGPPGELPDRHSV